MIKRHLPPAAFLVGSLLLAACGSSSLTPDSPEADNGGESAAGGSKSSGAAASGGATAGGTGGSALIALSCPPAPKVATSCPEAFDGSVPGAPPLVGPLGLVPLPESLELGRGTLKLTNESRIVAPSSATAIAELLASELRGSTGLALPVTTSCGTETDIVLDLDEKAPLPEEGYRIAIECSRAEVKARTPAGLFYGAQTIRELLPAKTLASSPQTITSITLPRVRIEDAPRFAWRGFMLDVARHFFSVAEVKRLIDVAAFHKLNRFHLHLSDDQGWRIQIDSWPKLTSVGSTSNAGGGSGGFYTKAQFKEINDYAAARFVTIVPEIDMPGHTNAALASYPKELSPAGNPPKPWPYTGIEVGFSSLWIGGPNTTKFVTDVIGELAAMTPGPYLHIGGDEAHSTTPSDYASFLAMVKPIVEAKGKTMIGWAEIGKATLGSTPVAQHWHDGSLDNALAARAQGMKIIMSPAQRLYLDMKYSKETPIGQDWAGLVSVEAAYAYEPTSSSFPENSILGVEATLFTEFVTSRADIDYLVFPRLSGHAEIAWSPAAGRSWSEYKPRLALHGTRLRALGIEFYESPDVAF